MKRIVREIKELIEASEPGVTVVVCSQDEPVACPVVKALWQEYREHIPYGV